MPCVTKTKSILVSKQIDIDEDAPLPIVPVETKFLDVPTKNAPSRELIVRPTALKHSSGMSLDIRL